MSPLVRRRILFVIGLVLALIVVWPLRTPLAAGIAFAYVSEGAHHYLVRKTKLRSTTGKMTLATCFVIVSYLVFVVPLVVIVYSALSKVVTVLSENKEAYSIADLNRFAAEFVGNILDKLGVDLSVSDVFSQMSRAASELSQSALSQVGNVLQATPQIIFHTFIMLLVWIFFLVDGQKWRAKLLPQLIPWKREREVISRTTGDVLRGAIVSNVMVSLVQAALMTIIFFSVGLPNAVVWGIAGFFSAFIPMVGTMLVILAAAGYCFIAGLMTKGIIILVSSLLVGTVDNVLRPMLMKGKTELNFFWLFVAFVGGVDVFGVTGLVLGPLIFSLFIAVLEMHRKTVDDRPPI